MSRALRRTFSRTRRVRIIDHTKPTTSPLSYRIAKSRRRNRIAKASRKANR